MRVIVSERIFEGLNIKLNNKNSFISNGKYQYTFNHSDPDKVIKTGRNHRTDIVDHKTGTITKYEGRDYNEGELYEFVEMQKHPKYFPIIYKIDKKAIEMEKLDSEKAKTQFLEIQSKIEEKFPGLEFDDFLSEYKETGKFFKMGGQMPEVYQYLKNNHPQIMANLYRFSYLVWNIMELKLFEIDISPSNFGYDKIGNLKMLDV